MIQQMPCADGQALDVRPSGGRSLADLANLHYANEQDRIEKHCRGKRFEDIHVGMRWHDVECLELWRKPSKINTTETARGKRSQYVYDRGAVRHYLYFDESMILRTIQR